MTREEAIERFNGIINAMSISIAQSKFYPSKAELNELCDMAIEALQKQTVYEQVKWERDMALQTLEEHGIGLGQKSDWIPVSERMPEDGYWLWSAVGGEVKKDFYYRGHWAIAEDFGYEVLAWKPLPAPYKESDSE